MKNSIWKTILGIIAVVVVALATRYGVAHYRKPGQLDVITAQAMDMSSMRPPAGVALVQLASAKTGSLGDTVTYTGSVQAYNMQQIFPRIAGVVLSLPVYPGDQVRAGQIVAQLDSDEVRARVAAAAATTQQAASAEKAVALTSHIHHHAALEQAMSNEAAARAQVDDADAQLSVARNAIGDAQAGVTSAQASVDYWNAEIAREKNLLAQGAVSQQEFESEHSQAQAASAALDSAQIKVREALSMQASARAKLTAAQNQAAAAKAGVNMASADTSTGQAEVSQAVDATRAAAAAQHEAGIVEGYTRIEAPVAGVVTERPVAPGTLVQPGTAILTIAQIDRVRIQAHVAVSDLGGIRPGTPVRIDVIGSGLPAIVAAVTSVFPAANDQTRTAIVEALVPNPGHKLLPGAFVSMHITKSVVLEQILVPASAVLSEGGLNYLWVAGNSLVAHRVDVQVGATDGAWTQISGSDLAAGDRVVVKGQAGLTEGCTVAEASWGPNGPLKASAPEQAVSRAIVYRCEKCGMIFSAADAAKDHYVDPMDGGKLVKVP